MGIVKGSMPDGSPFWYDDATGQQIDPGTGGPITVPKQPTAPVGGGLGGNGGTTPPPAGGFTNTSGVPSVGAPQQPFTPAQTTFNTGADATNGFNGVTYAGFSPQDHQGANLFDPMQAKYALQQYMVQNGALTGGQNGNAQSISDALNKLYGNAYGNQNFFKAQDAETILMPDGTYVHAAPNGYGLQSGQFNPNNSSEVFWGYQNGGPSTGGTGTATPTGSTNPTQTAGFRQYDPGIFTNDAGQFWDASGKQIAPPNGNGPTSIASLPSKQPVLTQQTAMPLTANATALGYNPVIPMKSLMRTS